MEKEFLEDSDLEERWLGVHDDGPFPLWRRRVLITKWAGEAWEETCLSMDFGKIGDSTGCNLTIQGDTPIKIEGCPNYSFEDVDVSSYPVESEASDRICLSVRARDRVKSWISQFYGFVITSTSQNI